MPIGFFAMMAVALGEAPATDTTVALPQPWTVDARRRKPFTYVPPTAAREAWSESRDVTDRLLLGDLVVGAWNERMFRGKVPAQVLLENRVQLVVRESGSRWDVTFSRQSVRVRTPAGLEAPETLPTGMLWTSPLGWTAADGDVELDAGHRDLSYVRSVVGEPLSQLQLAPPGGPVVPGQVWTEPISSATLPSDGRATSFTLATRGRFDGWVQRDGVWLALVSFELDLVLGGATEARSTTISHLLVDPADGLPVWAASLQEWHSGRMSGTYELLVRERYD